MNSLDLQSIGLGRLFRWVGLALLVAGGPVLAHAQSASDQMARVLYVGHDTKDIVLLEYRRALSEQIERKALTEPNLSKEATYGVAAAIVTIGADGQIVEVHVATAPSLARAKQTEELIRNSGPLAPFPPVLRIRADEIVLLVQLNFSK